MDSNRPLRQTNNKIRDIYNTYMKNQDKDNKKANKDLDQEASLEDLEEKIGAAMSSDDNEIPIELDSEPEANEVDDSSETDLEAVINMLKKDNDQLKDQLARRTAEMENMRKRTEKEKKDLILFANENLLADLIEIPDNIKQALIAAKDSNDFDALKKGIEMINSNTVRLFEKAGVKVMEVNSGDEFDVEKHEALLHSPNPDFEDGQIVQVVQDGYFYKEKILRHAKVITSSGAE